jgi:hypothetical protein
MWRNACASNGIGILSLKERARMLYGTFEIRSAPMKGMQHREYSAQEGPRDSLTLQEARMRGYLG